MRARGCKQRKSRWQKTPRDGTALRDVEAGVRILGIHTAGRGSRGQSRIGGAGSSDWSCHQGNRRSRVCTSVLATCKIGLIHWVSAGVFLEPVAAMTAGGGPALVVSRSESQARTEMARERFTSSGGGPWRRHGEAVEAAESLVPRGREVCRLADGLGRRGSGFVGVAAWRAAATGPLRSGGPLSSGSFGAGHRKCLAPAQWVRWPRALMYADGGDGRRRRWGKSERERDRSRRYSPGVAGWEGTSQPSKQAASPVDKAQS